jgi:hypothetical protein
MYGRRRVQAWLLAMAALAVAASGCLVGERPVLPDADSDGLPDVVERAGWNVTVYNDPVPCDDLDFLRQPIVYQVFSNEFLDDNDTDGLSDSDEFGLTDGQEWDLRQDRDRFFQRSKLWGADVDSDEDCLRDDEELVKGFDIERLGRTVFSDPTTNDGDRDGWTDWEEIFVRHTDPSLADTDGDGTADRVDVDPHRDLAVYVRFSHVRVDRESSGHAALFGNLVGHAIQSDPFPVTQGEWTQVPADASPGFVDVDDFGPDGNLSMAVSWNEVDADGSLVGNFDLAPAPGGTVSIRLRPAADAWAVQASSGDYPHEADSPCEIEGPDGAFRLDIRFGAAGSDPATLRDLCAA